MEYDYSSVKKGLDATLFVARSFVPDKLATDVLRPRQFQHDDISVLEQ